VGLAIFGTTVATSINLAPVPLGTNTVTTIKSRIANMRANSGSTNADDAVETAVTAVNTGLFTPGQLDLPVDQRIAQFLIFFTDGDPNRFGESFTYNGNDMTCVVSQPSRNSTTATDVNLSNCSSSYLGDVFPAGDGGKTNAIPYTACCSSSSKCPPTKNSERALNLRWKIFSDPDLGINPGSKYYATGTDYTGNYAFTDAAPPTVANRDLDCRMANGDMKFLPRYAFDLTEDLPLHHAQFLKDFGIKVYSIGLGTVQAPFLQKMSSDSPWNTTTPRYYNKADTPAELQGVFNFIAKDIEVRLAQ
jgi:hypothetical protein